MNQREFARTASRKSHLAILGSEKWGTAKFAINRGVRTAEEQHEFLKGVIIFAFFALQTASIVLILLERVNACNVIINAAKADNLLRGYVVSPVNHELGFFCRLYGLLREYLIAEKGAIFCLSHHKTAVCNLIGAFKNGTLATKLRLPYVVMNVGKQYPQKTSVLVVRLNCAT